jgi:hypothetical protein
MQPSELTQVATSLHKVGWFIPPYRPAAIMGTIASAIATLGDQYTQDQLERDLSILYQPEGLAAMVLHRYPEVPVIQEYKNTIAESVEAHFLGLDHVAVGGLIPVLEGVARRLAINRGIDCKGIKSVFERLAEAYKHFVIDRRIGATDELCVMLDSFANFARDLVYANSTLSVLVDSTNRHGIAHGAYTDDDYGRPLNFFKTISAIDFLTMLSSLDTSRVYVFAASPTDASRALAKRYATLVALRNSVRGPAGDKYSILEVTQQVAKYLEASVKTAALSEIPRQAPPE